MTIVDELYINYINTNKESYFTEFTQHITLILKSKFLNNNFFEEGKCHQFEDILQETLMLLFLKKNSFDINKGSVTTFAYTIFNRAIISELRKKNKINDSSIFLRVFDDFSDKY